MTEKKRKNAIIGGFLGFLGTGYVQCAHISLQRGHKFLHILHPYLQDDSCIFSVKPAGKDKIGLHPAQRML